MRIFAGFKSRWITPFETSSRNPVNISTKKSRAFSSTKWCYFLSKLENYDDYYDE